MFEALKKNKNQKRKENIIRHLYSKFFKNDLVKEHYLFLQLFSFTYPKSKGQVNGNIVFTTRSKPKQILPSQFAKVRL